MSARKAAQLHGLVSVTRAAELLCEEGDRVERSTLSRYVTKHAEALVPKKQGRETVVDFETLLTHRRENICLDAAPVETAATRTNITRADEAAKNARAQRLLRELDLAERAKTLTPVREVEEAAHTAVATLKGAFAQALNETADQIAALTGVEARLIRPHLRAFEKRGLDAFVRGLADYELTVPPEAAPH